MFLGTGISLHLNSTFQGDDMAWVRPADWPAMPATAAEQIDILAAVTDDGSNYVAVRATVSAGTYDVVWGDGTVSTGVTSGTDAEHLYDYADVDLGAVTTRGYKTAMIKMTPNTGGATITAFDIGRKHSRASLNAYTNPWLDVQVNCPSCTSMAYRGGVEARWLERITVVAIGAITTLSSAFQNCSSLKSIAFPSGSLASVTTLALAFGACSSLQSITFPSGSLAGVTTLASTFIRCSTPQSIAFPSGSLASVTDTTTAFSGCTNLARIQNCAIPITFSVASAKLAGAQLDEIYTALPSVTATITVSTNHGTPDDTPAIATGKGWTGTGS